GYFAVSFFLLAGADTGLEALRARSLSGWRGMLRAGAPTALAGVWALTLLFTAASPWVLRVLSANYADDLFAYQSLDPKWERFALVVDNCGPANAIVLLISIAALPTFRETRRIALVVGLMPPIMLWLMLKTSAPAPPHWYLFLPAYVLLPSLAFIVGLKNAAPILRGL